MALHFLAPLHNLPYTGSFFRLDLSLYRLCMTIQLLVIISVIEIENIALRAVKKFVVLPKLCLLSQLT